MIPRMAYADELTIASAANFLPVLQKISRAYEKKSGHKLLLVSGSSGQLAGQIINGAPFDVFLSADQARPEKLIKRGFAMADSRVTYALGKLVLWSRKAGIFSNVNDDGSDVLRRGKFRHLALANPALAPYGKAALQSLQSLHLITQLQPQLVQGQNIAQTFAMVASGGAELGFIAVAQLADGTYGGSTWVVPQGYYQPIKQDAVVLKRAANQQLAGDFLAFLRSPAGRSLIIAYGYGLVGE